MYFEKEKAGADPGFFLGGAVPLKEWHN